MKTANKAEKQPESDPKVEAKPVSKEEPAKTTINRAIPVKTITEAQKEAIRNRLSRKDISTKTTNIIFYKKYFFQTLYQSQ